MSNPHYGRYQVGEPPSNLACLHLDLRAPLKEVDYEPKIGVLDQSDLGRQGIDTAQLVSGAPTVDGLGSCTANALIEAASNVLTAPQFASLITELSGGSPTDPYVDVVAGERAAIVFYHDETSQTGDPSTEWPPTDCGSSGPYIVSEAIKLGACSHQRIAHGAHALVSLMQVGGIMWGTPFFYSWESPNSQGFVDNNGTTDDLQAAINSGVAGGHEIYLSAIEKLTLLPTGHIDALNTIIRFRNHWSESWGDHGSARVHLSTLVWLGGQCDFRQIRA